MARQLIAALVLCCAALITVRAAAQETSAPYQPQGVISTPRVEARWNYYRDYSEAAALLSDLATAFPGLCRVESLGASFGGREMLLATITDFSVGDPSQKPGMYIDGGIHANEIQAVEIPLYTAWYLCEMEAHSTFIAELLDKRVFYILPMLSPDSRDAHFYEPNDSSSPRTGQRPRDDDRDGLVDEDKPDDINGDGHITNMRKRDPNGRWKEDEEYPGRLMPADPDEQGEFLMLWDEGIDNDGDGEVNEDGDGFYDPNRDWAWNWQPPYVQWGAYRYPFSILENRMAAEFALAHPNIAGAQTYHNAGGIILRGPGAQSDNYAADDVAVYDLIGKRGEEMLPGYHYAVVHEDLYTVYGGEIDWFYMMRGALTFTNELWTSFNYFRQKEGTENWWGNQVEAEKFDRYLLFGEGKVPWQEFDHPTYGKIEIGGNEKNWRRQPPSFLLEEECHRNMAFTLYHADQLPLVEVQSVEVSDLGGGLLEVTAVIANRRPMPSRLSIDVQNAITRPDIVSLEGTGFSVVTAYHDRQPFFENAVEQLRDPGRVELPPVPGMGALYVRWLVEGQSPSAVAVSSVKGGSHRLATTAPTR